MPSKKNRKALQALQAYNEAHPESDAEISYKAAIKDLMPDYVTASTLDPDAKQIALGELTSKKKALDIKLIQERFPGFEIVGHVLLTRHGESSWKEKAIGLAINAVLSARQVLGLKSAKTNEYTHHLLHSPEKKVTVVASTMVRAKATARWTAPTQASLDIRLNKNVTEVGHWASSSAYTFTAGVGKPWWIFALIFTTPVLIKRYFDSKTVDKALASMQSDPSKNLHDPLEDKSESKNVLPEASENKPAKKSPWWWTKDTSKNFSSLSSKDKVESLQEMIDNHQKSDPETKGDFWVFSHGGLLKSFFKIKLGLEYLFDYLTTKEIYCLKSPDGQMVYFSPAGATKINVKGQMAGVSPDMDRGLASSFDRQKVIEKLLEDSIRDKKELARDIKLASTLLRMEGSDSSENVEYLNSSINQLRNSLNAFSRNQENLLKHIEISEQENPSLPSSDKISEQENPSLLSSDKKDNDKIREYMSAPAYKSLMKKFEQDLQKLEEKLSEKISSISPKEQTAGDENKHEVTTQQNASVSVSKFFIPKSSSSGIELGDKKSAPFANKEGVPEPRKLTK